MINADMSTSSLTYFELSEDKIVATYTRDATSFVAVLDLTTGKHIDLELEINDIAYDAMQRINDYEFLVIGASASCPPALYRISLDAETLHVKNTTVLARSLDMYRIPRGSVSTPKPFNFPRSSPDADTNPALKHGHAFLMLPTSPWYCSIPGKLPPCIVFAHGGPTKHHRPSVNLESQFMTSRGFAVVLLNHVGSTGYGGAYRDAMNGTWGVSDVQDAVDCVNALVRHGVVDGARIGITGGSAGGYLTLQAMCTAPETWAAGISICGISDMRAFARDTHKFESCYDQVLVRDIASQRHDGVNEDALYAARSPVAHVARLRAPLLLLQGTVDPVVLPNQAIMFEEAAKCHLPKEKRNGSIADEAVKLVMYENEGHGFHLASSKKHSLEEQEAWWLRSLCGKRYSLA
jgi:dipeptidyl aminopeptidase/acylaminoacyl peptidase